MWRVKSYNAFNLDNADYFSMLRLEDNPFLLPSVDVSITDSGEAASELGGFIRKADQLVVTVFVGKNSTVALIRNMAAAFNNLLDETNPLIVEEDGAGVQWYVEARPLNITRHKGNVFKVIFTVPDRIWRKSATPVVWNLSASPATQNVNNAGNLDTYPIFRVKPTVAKGGGFAYKSFVPIRNIIGDPFAGEALDINNNGSTISWVGDSAHSVQINQVGGIAIGATSIPYDTKVGNGLLAAGMAYLDDGTRQAQIAWTGGGGGTSGTLTGVTWGIGGTSISAYTFADNTVMKKSYCQANGADLRFYLDGIDQNIWLDGFNSATSNLWITQLNLNAKVFLTLKTAIPASGSISAIVFTSTAANQTALNSLPGSGLLQFGTELFFYTAKSPTQYKVTGITRAARDSVEAAQSANSSGYWIEHEGWLYSGNPALTARVNDDTKKPMFDIAQSTNTSHVYTEFWTLAGTRAMEFKKGVAKSNFSAAIGASLVYPGNRGVTVADPATDAGMKMQSVYQSGVWKAETGDIFISLYDPALMSDVNWTWERFRLGTFWPAIAALRASLNGTTYVNKINISTPPTSNVWDGPTASGATSLGGNYPYIDIRLNGTVNAGNTGGVGYNAMLETDSITLTRVSVPSATINARSTGSYEFDFELASDQNYSFAVHFVCKVDAELVIDCAEREMIYSVDGLEYRSAIFIPEGQADWFLFKSGNNLLTYTEDSPGSVQITVEYVQLLVD